MAAEQREKTRARLLASALLVFSQKGPHEPVIDDVIAHAGMARGSFYNYFKTNEELLAAVAGAVTDELLAAIDPVVVAIADPVARVATGARLLLRAVRQFPLLGAFLSRLPMPTANSGLAGIGFLARDLQAGVAAGRIGVAPAVALSVTIGIVFSAALSLSRETLADDYPEAVAQALLRGLGVEPGEAARIAALPLPVLCFEEMSILRKTQDGALQG
jgi:AcrR family transcriptional regulator